MKPISIIFLIVSAILIIVGLIVCSVAMIQAQNQNIALYDMEIENGQSKAEYDFSEDVFNRIQIEVGECDVNIICGAEDNKVVIRNFSSAGYICEVENRSLVIEDTINLLDFTDLAQGNFRFKGFRYYLRDRNLTAGEKSVTVYITDKFDIKAIDITVEKGVVTVQGYENATDYSVNIKSGTLKMENIVTDSTIEAKIGEGSVDLKEVTAKIITAEVEEGNIYTAVSGEEITLTAKKGNVRVDSMDDLSKFNFMLRAPASTVKLLDLVKSANYIANDAQLRRFIRATSGSGTVDVQVYTKTGQIEDIDAGEGE